MGIYTTGVKGEPLPKTSGGIGGSAIGPPQPSPKKQVRGGGGGGGGRDGGDVDERERLAQQFVEEQERLAKAADPQERLLLRLHLAMEALVDDGVPSFDPDRLTERAASLFGDDYVPEGADLEAAIHEATTTTMEEETADGMDRNDPIRLKDARSEGEFANTLHAAILITRRPGKTTMVSTGIIMQAFNVLMNTRWDIHNTKQQTVFELALTNFFHRKKVGTCAKPTVTDDEDLPTSVPGNCARNAWFYAQQAGFGENVGICRFAITMEPSGEMCMIGGGRGWPDHWIAIVGDKIYDPILFPTPIISKEEGEHGKMREYIKMLIDTKPQFVQDAIAKGQGLSVAIQYFDGEWIRGKGSSFDMDHKDGRDIHDRFHDLICYEQGDI